jgi:hypothetical protein
MTSPRHSRPLLVASVTLLGLIASACSGADGPDDVTGATLTASTEAVATTAPVPVDTTGAGSSVPPSTAATSTVPATDTAGTSSVPAPVATGQGVVVPVVTVAPQPATPIGVPASDAGGLRFAIESIDAVQGEASAPGEIGGPAVEVTVRATNTSNAPIEVSFTTVDLRHGADEVPAAPFAIGTSPLSGRLGPGASATGVYVFAVPEQRREQVRIYVTARPELPAVVFEGAAR